MARRKAGQSVGQNSAEDMAEVVGLDAKIFVAYKTEEEGLFRAVQEALQASGYTVWSQVDLKGKLGGRNGRLALNRLMDDADLTLVLWTKAASESDEVWAEAEYVRNLPSADNTGRYLGVLIEPIRLGAPFNVARRVDVTTTGLDGTGLAKIVDEVNARVGRHSPEDVEAPVVPPASKARNPDEKPQRVQGAIEGAALELQFYTDAINANTVAALLDYSAHYPHGKYSSEVKARLDSLRNPIKRWRHRVFSWATAATLLALVLAGYPVLKDVWLEPSGTIEQPVTSASVTDADAAPSETQVPVVVAESRVGGSATEPLQVPAETSVNATTMATTGLDLSTEVEACDIAAGSSAFRYELQALGRYPVTFSEIDAETAISACLEAYKIAPDSPRIRHQLARAYTKGGEASPERFDKAAELYLSNCPEEGTSFPASCANLASLYEEGQIGLKPNAGKAVLYYGLACDGGDAQSCANQAQRFRSSDGTRDLAKARSAAEKACSMSSVDGSGLGCRILGAMYEMGEIGGVPDYTRANENYIRSCDEGHARGCWAAANLMRNQVEIRDLVRAAEIARKGCDLAQADGSEGACWTLGDMYKLGEVEGTPDLGNAVMYYSASCDLGGVSGCAHAAYLLWSNDTVKDLGKAYFLATKACSRPQDVPSGNLSSVWGCSTAGQILESGRDGAQPDPLGALVNYRKACAGGFGWGCSAGGDLILSGLPGTDAKEAEALYEAGCAVDQDNGKADSCRKLGELRVSDKLPDGVNVRKATEAFTKGCELNDPWACAHLGYWIWDVAETLGEALAAVEPYSKACRIDPETCKYGAAFLLAYLEEEGLEGLSKEGVASVLLGALKEGDTDTARILTSREIDSAITTALQDLLAAEGHDIGSPDGKMGPKTKEVILSVCNCEG